MRQVLDQELHKLRTLQAAAARQARFAAGGATGQADAEDKENVNPKATEESKHATRAIERAAGVKRDFFGRIIANEETRDGGKGQQHAATKASKLGKKERIWVTYHEGYSNAVRKPISLKELMSGFL